MLSSATKRALGMARANATPCSNGTRASARLCNTSVITIERSAPNREPDRAPARNHRLRSVRTRAVRSNVLNHLPISGVFDPPGDGVGPSGCQGEGARTCRRAGSLIADERHVRQLSHGGNETLIAAGASPADQQQDATGVLPGAAGIEHAVDRRSEVGMRRTAPVSHGTGDNRCWREASGNVGPPAPTAF